MKNNKFKEFFRALKFTLISISAGIIQIGLFTLFNELCNWNYWAAYLTSLVASILWNFTINRKVTFKATNNVKIAMLLVFVFYLFYYNFVLTACSLHWREPIHINTERSNERLFVSIKFSFCRHDITCGKNSIGTRKIVFQHPTMKW